MDLSRRQRILEALAQARARVEEAYEDHQKASAVLSQAWVDKRRLLMAEDALRLLEVALGDDAIDTRALAEGLEALLHRARDLTPGHGLEAASRAILEALAEGDPEAPDPH
jgi:hypothetical protein